MTNLNFSSFFVFTFLVSSANAQIYRSRPRRPISRIIAGCIVGGLFALFFLALFCMMMRRRRRGMNSGVVNSNQFMGKPMFGGPWGRSNPPPAASMQSYGPNQGAGYNNSNPLTPNSDMNVNQTPNNQYNPEYPPQNAPPPPPTYGQEANYGGKYSAPSGPPPPVPQNNNNASYAPPMGPPPAAHTTGEDSNFVGGFHSPRT